MRACTIGKQLQLLLFDAILHLAPDAIDFSVKGLFIANTRVLPFIRGKYSSL
jgi:hypothetical protein